MKFYNIAQEAGFDIQSWMSSRVEQLQRDATEDDIVTIWPDKKMIAYRDDFFNILTDEERNFVVGHEIDHVTRNHAYLKTIKVISELEGEIDADNYASCILGIDPNHGIKALVKSALFLARQIGEENNETYLNKRYFHNGDSTLYHRLSALSQLARG